jgi:WD40 repeat protein
VAVNGVGSFVVESPTCEFGLGFAGQCDVAFTINGNDLTLEVPTDSTGFTFFTEVLDGDTGAPQLAFDGRVLALGGPDSSLVFGQHVDANGRPHLFVEDLTQGRTVFSEDDPTRTVVAAVADAERLVVSTEDGAVRAWDLRDGRGPIDLVAARSLMIGLVLDASAPTEPRVYGVGIGSGVTQWDLSNPGAADRIGTTGQGAALADDGESVVEPSPDGRQILVRNLVTGAVTSGPVLAPGEQIDYLLTRSSQGPVVANLVAGSAVVTSGPRVVGRVPVPVADISRSGTRLATVPSDARVVDVIDVGDLGSVTRSIELSALSPDAYQEVPDVVALDSTGQRLAATNATGEVVVWDVSSGAVLAELPGAPVDLRSFPLFGLSFSPEGLRLVVKSPSNLVRMYSTATWTEVANQQLSARDTAGRVVFSPDGEFVAVDGLFLFDGTTLEPVARLVSGTGIGTKFSADNRYLSTITDRGEVLRWDIGVAALVDQACTLAGRNMTPQEWTRYMGAVPYRETCPR